MTRQYKRRRYSDAITRPAEKDITMAIIAFLRLHGIVCWWTRQELTRNRSNAADMPGLPDVVGYLKPMGRFFAFEVKRPCRPAPFTQEQKAFLDAVSAGGGVSGRVNSISDVQKILGGYLKR